METLQYRPEAYLPGHTPHTPPYTPYAPSRRRFERAGSPASAKSIQPLETSSPAKKAATSSSADEDNVKVQELVEGDVGYATDIGVVYPEELEEVDSDTEEEPSTSESDDEITDTFSRLGCQDDQEAEFQRKRIERHMRKRKEARIFKRTHSQFVKMDSDQADSDAMADQDPTASKGRQRKRVRRPPGVADVFESTSIHTPSSSRLAPAAEIHERSSTSRQDKCDTRDQHDAMDVDESE